MRVLVSGVNGFVGGHLVRELRDAGHDVLGVGNGSPDGATTALLDDYVAADLTVGWPATPPVDAIVHLAALSAVGPSFARPQDYLETNSAMVTHLGESLLRRDERPRVLLVSSGAVYDSGQPLPIGEDGLLAFSSPYAVSKVLTEHQAAYYATRDLDWIVARPFNHVGPGQGTGFLLPDLYDQLTRPTPGARKLVVGDLSTERDYTDVRDVVRAYRLLLEADDPGARVFNVCSGAAVSGNELLAHLLAATGTHDVPTEVDPSRLRPGDPRRIVGDSGLLRRAVGWTPRYDLAQTVGDFVASQAERSR